MQNNIQNNRINNNPNNPNNPNINNNINNNHPVNKNNPIPKPEKPTINWGDNLDGPNRDISRYQDKIDKRNKTFNWNLLFNFICLILCVSGFFFVYTKYLKNKDSEDIISFGGLKYKIDEQFVMKTDESNSRYYTYKDNCAVRINYGTTSTPESFVESYFEKVKDTYSNQEGYTTSIQKLKINDNEWSELTVQGMKENSSNTGGYSLNAKYKHIAIVYKNNYYDLVYANADDDVVCLNMYDNLIKSFSFDN